MYIITIVLIAPIFVSGAYYLALYIAWDRDPHFIKADTCLGEGGVWQSDIKRCWMAGECEDEGGFWYPSESRCAYEHEFENSLTSDVRDPS